MVNFSDHLQPDSIINIYGHGRKSFQYLKHDEHHVYMTSYDYLEKKTKRHRFKLENISCVKNKLETGGYVMIYEFATTYYNDNDIIHRLDGPAQIMGTDSFYSIDGAWISEGQFKMITFTLHRQAQNENVQES